MSESTGCSGHTDYEMIKTENEMKNHGDEFVDNDEAELVDNHEEEEEDQPVATGNPGDEVSKSGTADEYHYTKRDDFTSELFKISISGLRKRFGFNELRKKLNSLNLKPVKIKVWKALCFVTFRCEADREDALQALNGLKWKGNTLKAQTARPAADPLMRKRKQEESEQDSSGEKKQRDNEDEGVSVSPAEQLKNAVAPLWSMPYEDQLKKKQEDMKMVLKKLGRQIEKCCPDLRNWLKEQRGKNSGLCCELLDILPSPKRSGYRNKCEFTVGQGMNGSDVVGFRFGQYAQGSVYVGTPDEVSFLPDTMKTVLKHFQCYLMSSQYRSFSPENHTGHWRQLTIRTSRLGHLMVMIDFHPQNLSEGDLEKEKTQLKEYFTSGSDQTLCVSSLFFRTHCERSVGGNVDKPYELLFGDPHITENLLGLQFRISPDAFFQVNTDAAEVLYQQVSDWCSVSPTTTVLDICCGTGTIGQTIAKGVKSVIGVEMCSQAIKDAKMNAEINDIANVTYHCSKAEDIIQSVTRSLWSSSDVVAVVDPPRSGLHGSVVVALRNCTGINRLVYVSCNPTGAMNNFTDLVRPMSKRLKGPRFYPVKAVPVDLFPDTKHCELVIQFQRWDTDQ